MTSIDISTKGIAATRVEITNEMVRRAAMVLDPQIIPIIEEYCAKKDYGPAEVEAEINNSGRWRQARHMARTMLEAALQPANGGESK